MKYAAAGWLLCLITAFGYLALLMNCVENLNHLVLYQTLYFSLFSLPEFVIASYSADPIPRCVWLCWNRCAPLYSLTLKHTQYNNISIPISLSPRQSVCLRLSVLPVVPPSLSLALPLAHIYIGLCTHTHRLSHSNTHLYLAHIQTNISGKHRV